MGLTYAGMNRCAGGLGLQSHVQRELEKSKQRPLPGVVGLSHHCSAVCCGTAGSSEAAGTQWGTGEVPVTQVRHDLRDSMGALTCWHGAPG